MWQGIDRRKFPRVNIGCKIIIHKKQGVEKYYFQAENISAGGLCGILEKDLGLFSLADLEIMLDEGRNNIVKSRAKIVWIVKKISEGKNTHHFDTGFEFIDLNPEDKKKIDKVLKKSE